MTDPRADDGTRASAFSCVPLIRLSLNVAATPDLEMTSELARAIFLFEDQFMASALVLNLSQPKQEICQEQAVAAFATILKLVNKRLLYLLKEKRDLNRYYSEFKTFLSPWADEKRARLAQSSNFAETHREYSTQLHEVLIQEIQLMNDPVWEKYSSMPVSLVAWTKQWTSSLGRNEPAAVNLIDGHIALQSQSLEPEAMKILLFHELAHLSDPKRPLRKLTIKEQYANELYAWRETFKFLEARTKAGISVPSHFKYKVLPVVQFMGLEAWVKGVVISRGL